jgi:hypothetical protein
MLFTKKSPYPSIKLGIKLGMSQIQIYSTVSKPVCWLWGFKQSVYNYRRLRLYTSKKFNNLNMNLRVSEVFFTNEHVSLIDSQ